MTDATIHLERMAELTGETDIELLLPRSDDCSPCGSCSIGTYDYHALINPRSRAFARKSSDERLATMPICKKRNLRCILAVDFHDALNAGILTPRDTIPEDHYECSVCRKLSHCDEMLQPTGRDNGDLCCSESCCWDYNQLAGERCHGE